MAVACGAADAGAGAGAVSVTRTGADSEKDGDLCGVTPPGEEPPGEACIGISSSIRSLVSKSEALV